MIIKAVSSAGIQPLVKKPLRTEQAKDAEYVSFCSFFPASA